MKRNVLIGLIPLLLAILTAIWWQGTDKRSGGLDPLRAHDGGRGMPKGELTIADLAVSGEAPEPADLRASKTSRHDGMLGVCIDHHDLEGVPGVQLTFLSDSAHVGGAESDARGEFQLRLSAPTFDEVLVEPPRGYWCVKHGEKRGEYQVRLARDDVSPLRAKLIDKVKGDPLPFFAVELRGPNDWSEIAMSDKDGRIESETLFEAGEISLFTTEAEFGALFPNRLLATHAHQPAGAEPAVASIAVDGGATYYLALENPGKLPLSSLGASLSHPWNLEDEQLYTGQLRGATIYPGKYPWTRIHWAVSNTQKPKLVVEDHAGRWRGFADVDSSSGVHPTPVAILLEPRLRLSGHVYNAQGEPVQGAQVQLLRASNESFWDGASSSVLGLYVIDGVQPGDYLLTALGVRDGRAEMKVHIGGTLPMEQDLHLEPYVVGGDVRGTVRSLSGKFKRQTRVSLRPVIADAELPSRFTSVVWEEIGSEIEGHYKFDQVAAGTYEVSLGRLYATDFKPRGSTVRAGGGGVDFVVRDDATRFRKGFQAVDGTSGEKLPKAYVQVVNAQGELVYDGLLAKNAKPIWLAEEEKFTWAVRCEGFVTATGDRVAYEALADASHNTKRVALTPTAKSD